jgi:hypothetical protein
MIDMKFTGDKVPVRQAAGESGFSEAWWRKQISRRQVPFYRVGGRILVSRRDIAALFRKGRVEPVEPITRDVLNSLAESPVQKPQRTATPSDRVPKERDDKRTTSVRDSVAP